MDISSVLPILLGKTDLKDKTKLLTALASGGKPEDILAGALPPEASGLLGLLNNRASSPSRRTAPGLSAVSHFAPPDILGTLYKLMA